MVKKEVSKKSVKGRGLSLDEAFEGDEDVEYGVSKPRKVVKKDQKKIEEISSDECEILIKASKDISEIKKGDKVKVDGKEYEVDSHYVMIDHGATKEMAIEVFDKKSDKDYQLRYFDDRVKESLEFYELKEIVYGRVEISKVEW